MDYLKGPHYTVFVVASVSANRNSKSVLSIKSMVGSSSIVSLVYGLHVFLCYMKNNIYGTIGFVINLASYSLRS